MGDMDRPFETAPVVEADYSDAALCGGLSVAAGVLPGEPPMPMLVFHFMRYDGVPLVPIVLALEPASIVGLPPLIASAVATAARGAAHASGQDNNRG